MGFSLLALDVEGEKKKKNTTEIRGKWYEALTTLEKVVHQF